MTTLTPLFSTGVGHFHLVCLPGGKEVLRFLTKSQLWGSYREGWVPILAGQGPRTAQPEDSQDEQGPSLLELSMWWEPRSTESSQEMAESRAGCVNPTGGAAGAEGEEMTLAG